MTSTTALANTAAPAQALDPLAENVWAVKRRLRFLGAEVGTRMTVVRLNAGGLWLHSPVPLSNELAKQLADLGPIRHLVAPNRMHHLFIGQVHEQAPDAGLFIAPGLAEKRPQLAAGTVLENGVEYPWSGEIDHHCVGGLRVLGEVVFCHRPSRTLILTDLAFNIGNEAPFFSRLFHRLNGAYGRLRCPRDVRWLFVARRKELAESLRVIDSWDFDRVVMAHGNVVREGGRQAFEDAFSFVRRG